MIRTVEGAYWDAQYLRGDSWHWDTGRPSSELERVLAEYRIAPTHALELGCGTGTNALWLAERGFQVTAVDISQVAIARAREKAAASGTATRFLAGDLCDWSELGGPYHFFFDRGCYHAVRRHDREGYLRSLEKLTFPGALGLLLMGHAGEPEDEIGPPPVREDEIREELGALFEMLHLRPFRFDAPRTGDREYLAWSCLVRRRPQ